MKLSFCDLRIKIIAALICGALMPFGFAPVSQTWLLLVGLIGWFLLATELTPIAALWCGFSLGCGFFGVGISWVFVSIHVYGHSNVVVASLITALFVVILSLFPAAASYLWRRYWQGDTHLGVRSVLAFAALWTLAEWLRSHIFTGFPWLLLGDSQTNTWLAGYLPLLGSFGVSFLLLVSGGFIALWLKKPRQWWRGGLALLIWVGGLALAQVVWTTPDTGKTTVSLVQASIPQSDKWQPGELDNILGRYLRLTATHWTSPLIVWPEAAIPTLQRRVQPFLDELAATAKQHHSTLITGIVTTNPRNQFQYYNTLLALGDHSGLYYKRHLVPFGEYLPFAHWLRGIINFLNLPMSDFSAGPMHQALLMGAHLRIGATICYEIAYSDVVRADLPLAQILLTASDDSWFGDSLAPGQHAQIAATRALEAGRYLLFASNDGWTGIINPQGQFESHAPMYAQTVVTGIVQGMQGSTPWIVWGDWPAVIICGLLLVGLLLRRRPQALTGESRKY